jgi:hypothetical protein
VSSLLRSSQAAERLTKEAFWTTPESRAAWEAKYPKSMMGRALSSVGRGTVRAGSSVGRGVGRVTSRLGRFAMKHPVGALATAAGLSSGIITAAEGIRGAQGGMEYPYPRPRSPQTGHQMLIGGM